jgi:hypothetical protein
MSDRCVVCRGPKTPGFAFCDLCREELRELMLRDPEYRAVVMERRPK